MTNRPCALCKAHVGLNQRAVELVGGFFDLEDPDFFVMDDGVLALSYVHLECLLKAVKNERGG